MSFLPSELPECKPHRKKERREFTPIHTAILVERALYQTTLQLLVLLLFGTKPHKTSALSKEMPEETNAQANFDV